MTTIQLQQNLSVLRQLRSQIMEQYVEATNEKEETKFQSQYQQITSVIKSFEKEVN